MFETIQRLFNDSRLSKDGVANAVLKGWITPDQYFDIAGEPYTA